MKTTLNTTTKAVLLFLIMAVAAHQSLSQVIGDTIIFYIDKQVEVKISVPNYSNLQSKNEISLALMSMRKAIPALSDDLSSNRADLVRFEPDGSISIKPGDPSVIYQQGTDGLVGTGFRDRATMLKDDFGITVSAGDISTIANVQLESSLNNVISKLPERTWLSRTLYFECIDNQTTELSDKHIVNPPGEFLELEMGAGAGLVRNNWVTDFSFGVGVDFNKKGAHRFPYISTNMLFDFAEGNQINVNTFLNVGYGWNVTKFSPRKDKLYVELGYLVSRKGDLFEENTFRLGFKWAPIKGVYVSPHIYASDGLSNIYPGVRIGFGI